MTESDKNFSTQYLGKWYYDSREPREPIETTIKWYSGEIQPLYDDYYLCVVGYRHWARKQILSWSGLHWQDDWDKVWDDYVMCWAEVDIPSRWQP